MGKPRRMPKVGETLNGTYRLTRELGVGGFGYVFAGEDLLHNDRLIAVKLPRYPEHFVQFQNEAINLLLLQHPNRHPHIVAILDFKLTEEGLPFFVMEYAANGSLQDEIDRQNGLTPAGRSILLAGQIGDALGYLHDRRTVHQDVKPANVLLPDEKNAWLSDLGVVKILNPGESHKPVPTPLSPHYAAPEQWDGKAEPASDQYSLGILAYYALTGRLPYEADNHLGLGLLHKTGHPQSLPEAMKLLVDERLLHILRALDPLVQQAIAKEPSRRHASVTVFTKALQQAYSNASTEKLQEVFPVAKPVIEIQQSNPIEDTSQIPTVPNTFNQIQPEGRMSQAPTIEDFNTIKDDETFSGDTVARTSLVAVKSEQYPSAPPPLDRDMEELIIRFLRHEKHLRYYILSHVANDQDEQEKAAPDIWLPLPVRLEQIKGDRHSLEAFVMANKDNCLKFSLRLIGKPVKDIEGKDAMLLAHHTFRVRVGQRALGIPSHQLLPWSPLMQRLLAQVTHSDLQRVIKEDMALAPTTSDVAPAKEQQEIPVQPQSVLCQKCGAQNRQGAKFCNQCASPLLSPRKALEMKEPAQPVPAENQRVEANTSELITEYTGHLGTGTAVFSVAWSPDGKYIVSGSRDGTAQVWEAMTGRLITAYERHSDPAWESVYSVAWSPDGKYIVSGSRDKTAHVWEAMTGNLILEYKGHSDLVWSVAWSPKGKYIVSGSWDKTAQMWEAITGNMITKHEGHSGTVGSVAWSPDGKYIVSGSRDKTAQVWEAMTGNSILEYKGHSDDVWSVAWSPNGKYIVSGGPAHLWEAITGRLIVEYKGYDSVYSASFSPDGKYIVSKSGGGTICVLEVMTGELITEYKGHSKGMRSASFSPDGKYIVSANMKDTVWVWAANLTQREIILKRPAEVQAQEALNELLTHLKLRDSSIADPYTALEDNVGAAIANKPSSVTIEDCIIEVLINMYIPDTYKRALTWAQINRMSDTDRQDLVRMLGLQAAKDKEVEVIADRLENAVWVTDATTLDGITEPLTPLKIVDALRAEAAGKTPTLEQAVKVFEQLKVRDDDYREAVLRGLYDFDQNQLRAVMNAFGWKAEAGKTEWEVIADRLKFASQKLPAQQVFAALQMRRRMRGLTPAEAIEVLKSL